MIIQTNQRIGYIDALKGFVILCVVLGHIIAGYVGTVAYPEAIGLLNNIYNLIYAFHMPLFMMLSGYLYYTAYFSDSGMPDRRRIYRRMYNLMGVYVIFCAFMGLSMTLIRSLISGIQVPEVTLLDVALMWIRSIDIYWYLYVLILLYLIFSIKRLIEVNRWILLGAFTAAAVCAQVVSIPWFEVSHTVYYALFFFIGIAGKKYKDWIIGNKKVTLVLFVVAVGVGLLVWSIKRDTSRYSNEIVILSIVVALGVSLALWYAFKHINILGNSGILKLCGRYSLEIYVIHEYFTAGLRRVLMKIGVHNVYISLVLNLIISTAVPVLFSMLCKKLNIYGLFFQPVTYVMKKLGKDVSISDG